MVRIVPVLLPLRLRHRPRCALPGGLGCCGTLFGRLALPETEPFTNFYSLDELAEHIPSFRQRPFQNSQRGHDSHLGGPQRREGERSTGNGAGDVGLKNPVYCPHSDFSFPFSVAGKAYVNPSIYSRSSPLSSNNLLRISSLTCSNTSVP